MEFVFCFVFEFYVFFAAVFKAFNSVDAISKGKGPSHFCNLFPTFNSFLF